MSPLFPTPTLSISSKRITGLLDFTYLKAYIIIPGKDPI